MVKICNSAVVCSAYAACYDNVHCVVPFYAHLHLILHGGSILHNVCNILDCLAICIWSANYRRITILTIIDLLAA